LELTEILERLFEKNRTFYHRFCLKYIKDPAKMEDCLQDGFEKFLQCGQTFNDLIEAEKYLCRLLNNHFIDSLRKSSTTKATRNVSIQRPELFANSEIGPEGRVQEIQRNTFHREAIRLICLNLEKLPPHQREIIDLFFLKDPPMSCKEISRQKKIPITTVYSRSRAALNNLWSICGDLLEEWKKY